ncbi:MAG: cupredoxin domain-containing protein [Armatimonadota bacterium]|nr:cupredoxin domain-containing protein [Armatimonadota bacterium]MDR5703859.1 cupredoxin domain-containing protein [Armatimonadota bacterium]
MRRRLLYILLSLNLLCAVGFTSPGATAPPGKPKVVEVVVREFEIVPKEIAVKPGEVLFVVRNTGAIEHDFAIEDAAAKSVARIAVIPPGKQEELRVALRPGLYTVLCTLPGHKDAGMKGMLNVQDSSS